MRTIRLPRPEFFTDAACRGGDPAVIALFFPTRGNTHRKALALCADCPVRRPCLDYALDRPELVGIWGGATDDDRDRLRRQIA